MGDDVVGAAALHVLWEDIAELRTVVVDKAVRGQGVGRVLVARLVDEARELGLKRLFVLTFETSFFAGHGFVEIDGTPVSHDVYEEMPWHLKEQRQAMIDELEAKRRWPS